MIRERRGGDQVDLLDVAQFGPLSTGTYRCAQSYKLDHKIFYNPSFTSTSQIRLEEIGLDPTIYYSPIVTNVHQRASASNSHVFTSTGLPTGSKRSFRQTFDQTGIYLYHGIRIRRDSCAPSTSESAYHLAGSVSVHRIANNSILQPPFVRCELAHLCYASTI